ncbi:uncharacterized protein LOC130445626 [Diorhabda sublineata]|uniref:uncharacterized protein LOC130445626 n=1 Tax=Diorhabda sublineata TaxID=1163346 RepID=UPI0024E04D3D|nr:uncharacterized protein LOC130445626 [Diorhabda sublineata]
MAINFYKEMIGGQKIPSIGLGTWMSTDETELETALNAAIEAGYRHIDTAIVYHNESLIGRILKGWFSSGKLRREDFFITTKLPIAGLHEDRVEMFIKKSLENLQLDYLDLYLIHFPVASNYVGLDVTPPDQFKLEPVDHHLVWKKMEEQVDAGRTRAIGLSNFNENQIQKLLKSCRIQPACLQIEVHLFMQQKELINFCHKNHILVIAYSPLGNPGYNKFLNVIGQKEKQLPSALDNPIVKSVADKYKKSPGQVLLRFLIEKDIIPIPKSVSPKRIRENIDVFDFTLDKEDIHKLENVDRGEESRICDFSFFPPLLESEHFPFVKQRV